MTSALDIPLQPQSRRRGGALAPWAVNVGLALLALAVGLLLAELLVRLVAPQQLILVRPDVWQPVDTLGWKFRPNLATRINWGERTVSLYTDANGFRVGRSGVIQAPPRRRVLLIGDSFMAALQVEYEQSLPALLESDLHVGVRNAGQAGWDPPQYLFGARQFLARDTFGLVIVSVYIGNDIVTRRPDRIAPRVPVEIRHLRLPRGIGKGELVDALVRPVNDFLEQRSHLFIFAKKRLETLRMRAGMTDDYFPDEFKKSTADSPRWDVTAGILADVAAEASRRRIRTVFVLIPAPFQVDTATFRRFITGFDIDSTQVDMDQPSRLMAGRLRARGLDVIDVLPEFRAAVAQAGGGPKLYGDIDRHLSPRGHEVLARLVEPRVAELLR